MEDKSDKFKNVTIPVKEQSDNPSKPDIFAAEKSKLQPINLLIFPITATVFCIMIFLSGADLVNTLIWGGALSFSISLLIISTLQVGSKLFFLNFIYFMVIGILLAVFGMPSWFEKFMEASGLTYSHLSVAVAVLTFAYFIFLGFCQWRDLKRTVIEVDSQEMKLEKKLQKKAPAKPKPKPEPKKKKNKMKLDEGRIKRSHASFREPVIFEQFRNKIIHNGFMVFAVSFVFILGTQKLDDYYWVVTICIAAVCIFLMMVPMIKPGTKRFWIVFGSVIFICIPTFLAIHIFSEDNSEEGRYIYNSSNTVRTDKRTRETYYLDADSGKWVKAPKP
jgi:hypothetical protein